MTTDTLLRLHLCLPAELEETRYIGRDTEFDADLGMDSLDFLQFISDVQDEFRVEIPNEALKKFRTFGDLEGWLRARPETLASSRAGGASPALGIERAE
jgi:acyl carrier protein